MVASCSPYNPFETCAGAVGNKITGRSQTIVSMGITFGGCHSVSPIQFKDETAVTNSKCNLHFKTTISVSNEGVT